METDKDHIHFLISYDTTDRVCDIVKIVKQENLRVIGVYSHIFSEDKKRINMQIHECDF